MRRRQILGRVGESGSASRSGYHVPWRALIHAVVDLQPARKAGGKIRRAVVTPRIATVAEAGSDDVIKGAEQARDGDQILTQTGSSVKRLPSVPGTRGASTRSSTSQRAPAQVGVSKIWHDDATRAEVSDAS